MATRRRRTSWQFLGTCVIGNSHRLGSGAESAVIIEIEGSRVHHHFLLVGCCELQRAMMLSVMMVQREDSDELRMKRMRQRFRSPAHKTDVLLQHFAALTSWS